MEVPTHVCEACFQRKGPGITSFDCVTSMGHTWRPLRLREGDQPLPVPNERTDVQSQLIEHIRERRNLGVQRYGTALQPFNGRDAGQDLLDELLDGATYAMQLVIERRELEDRNRALQSRVADLEAENATLRRDCATLTEELVSIEHSHCGCISTSVAAQ